MPARALPLAIAGAVFALDRATKLLIQKYVSFSDTYNVIPGFFDIVHAQNPGAAFGMFAEGDSELRTFVLIGVSLAVLCFVSLLLFRPARGGFTTSRLTIVALSLVLGGAIGNLWDRVAQGMVTDFLEFYVGQYRFAAFNVADSAITIGACLLLIDIWRSRKQTVVT